jgi:hypothetical protein
MSVSCHADDNAFVIYVMCCVQEIQALYKFFLQQVLVQKWRPHWYVQCLGQSFWCVVCCISILQNTGGSTFWFKGVSLIFLVWRFVNCSFVSDINVKKGSEVPQISKNPFKNMPIHHCSILFSHMFVLFVKTSCHSFSWLLSTRSLQR